MHTMFLKNRNGRHASIVSPSQVLEWKFSKDALRCEGMSIK